MKKGQRTHGESDASALANTERLARSEKAAPMTDSIASPRSTLAARLSDVPERILPRVRRGFQIASELNPEVRRQCVHDILSRLASQSRPEPSDIGGKVGLSASDAGDLLLAVSLTFGAMIDISASPDDFIQEASTLYDESGKAAVSEISIAVSTRRDELKESMDNSSLANSVLPSLVQFDLDIDIRVKFENNKVINSAPVAVVFIGSDREGQDICLQLSKTDIDMLVDRLTKASGEMDLAGRLIDKSSRS
ncbi:MAG: hypothetical protein ACHP7N_03955 [Caulobacterales bacterium]